MTTLQKTLITATLAAAVGTGIYETRQASALRTQVQTLQQQAPLAGQIEQVTRERDDATRQLAGLRDDNERLKRNTAELLRLRGKVGRLGEEARELARLKGAADTKAAANADDPIEAEAKTLVAKAQKLKQLFDRMPDKKIPELEYLGAQAWLNAAQTANLETDADVGKTLCELRLEAKNMFAAVGIELALDSYTKANAGQLPSDISQLKPYFPMLEVSDDVLQRYQIVKTGNVNNVHPGDVLIAEKSPVDEAYDTLFQFGLGTWSWQGTGANTNQRGTGGVWHGPASTK